MEDEKELFLKMEDDIIIWKFMKIFELPTFLTGRQNLTDAP